MKGTVKINSCQFLHFTYKEPETKRLIYVLKSFREFVQILPAGQLDKVELQALKAVERPILSLRAPAHQCPISLRIHLTIISISSSPAMVWPTQPPKRSIEPILFLTEGHHGNLSFYSQIQQGLSNLPPYFMPGSLSETLIRSCQSHTLKIQCYAQLEWLSG